LLVAVGMSPPAHRATFCTMVPTCRDVSRHPCPKTRQPGRLTATDVAATGSRGAAWGGRRGPVANGSFRARRAPYTVAHAEHRPAGVEMPKTGLDAEARQGLAMVSPPLIYALLLLAAPLA